jgi:hypothetical protein
MIEEVIDGLTNSVVEIATGRKYATKIRRVELRDVMMLSQEGWRFDWVGQMDVGEVYGLQIPKAGRAIHGLMSLSRESRFIQLQLLESHPENVGRSKKFKGVAGNLVAYAARMAFELGFPGHVAFEAKTESATVSGCIWIGQPPRNWWLNILEDHMEPTFEPDDVDLVISSGRWSEEVLAEVAEFFTQCDDEVPSLAVSESNSKNRKSAAAADVIRPGVPGT